MLNIFNDDAFSVVSLTDTINEMVWRSNRIGDMGLFEADSVATTMISLERIGDTLKLVAPTPRGGRGDVRDNDKRTLKSFVVPHFLREWSVLADEVQNVRAYGSATALETLQAVVMRRIAQNIRDLNVTDELSRIGAIQGIITYADGSTLNLFSEFGVAPPSEIDFDLDAVNPAAGALRDKCDEVITKTRKALGNVPFDHVHAFVGDTFFKQVLKHKEVTDTYAGWSEARILRESLTGNNRSNNKMFEYGGIVFENYAPLADSGDGTKIGIEATKAKFFPVGVDGLFRTYYAPAPYNETVNTLGQRFYAKQKSMDYDKGIEGEVQTNALHICTRVEALQKAKNT